MRDQDFDPVADAFRGSLAYRMSRTVIERSSVAVGESVALTRLRTSTRSFASENVQSQIRTVAITLAIASIAHLAIRELLPRYATSGLPWWWNVAAAVLAATVALLAGEISSAWGDSTPAKLWRRFTA